MKMEDDFDNPKIILKFLGKRYKNLDKVIYPYSEIVNKHKINSKKLAHMQVAEDIIENAKNKEEMTKYWFDLISESGD